MYYIHLGVSISKQTCYTGMCHYFMLSVTFFFDGILLLTYILDCCLYVHVVHNWALVFDSIICISWTCRIRQIVSEGKSDVVVDVDGSYLYSKYRKLCDAGANLAPLPKPLPPQAGLGYLTPDNYASKSSSIPTVTQGIS